MRTTIDIPDHLLRQAKAQAALRGIKLKDLVAEALRAVLYGTASETGSPDRRSEQPTEDHRLVLGEHCVFPLVRGECGPAMGDLTDEKIHEILEQEDIERALGPR